MTDRFLRKFTMFRLIGLICLVSGLYATFLRFTQGLGASTNLSDTFPWGLWVGFDVVCGVGLAAGGFTISAMVYILRIEKYRPLARPAVLTAFIGYLLVVGGLIFDLGLPWRIWHPMVMWNPHSVMFEVAWCVTLYTTVLAAEASAMVFEKLKMRRSTKVAHKLTFPLTVAAVCLSMLHQSSLGSLFLLVPGRLHELWWTPFLPLLFFLSAIAVGLVMTIIESNLSARAFGREIEADVLQNAAKVASVVMVLYLVVRFADLIHRGVLTTLWPLDRAGAFFILEILAGFALPIVLFNSTKIYAEQPLALPRRPARSARVHHQPTERERDRLRGRLRLHLHPCVDRSRRDSHDRDGRRHRLLPGGALPSGLREGHARGRKAEDLEVGGGTTSPAWLGLQGDGPFVTLRPSTYFA
ncbi:MAG: NrfD/PsrC family molybdoenzyme membrane anchor subunit [Candidatus Eisenbacteria bacterium]